MRFHEKNNQFSEIFRKIEKLNKMSFSSVHHSVLHIIEVLFGLTLFRTRRNSNFIYKSS